MCVYSYKYFFTAGWPGTVLGFRDKAALSNVQIKSLLTHSLHLGTRKNTELQAHTYPMISAM